MKPTAASRHVASSTHLLRTAVISAVLFSGAVAFAQTPNAAATEVDESIVAKPLTPPANDAPTAQPSPQHVWIPGHWHWGRGAYVWVGGRWEMPPATNTIWVAPQWRPQGTGYVLQEGYWQQGSTIPPSSATMTTTPSAVQPTETSTTQTPPGPKPETIPPQPSPAYVWQPGYWDWRNDQFTWANGHWDLPPRQNVVWVPTHWETRDGRWVLVSGYWRDDSGMAAAAPSAPVANQVIVTQPTVPAPTQVVVIPPPPPPRETILVRPSPFHVWVPGFWAWRYGRYVWIPGHWDRPPRGRRHWIEPRWERRGGNYIFIEGHWR